MKVIKWLELKRHYEEETEKARLEMVDAIKERDLVFSEIKEQRDWLKNINEVINVREWRKDSVLQQLKSLWVNLVNERTTFETITYKYKATTDKISKNLDKWVLEIDSIKKEIEKHKIDLVEYKKQQKYKKDLGSEIKKLENYKTIFEIESDEKEKWLILERERFDIEYSDFRDYVKSINKKDEKLKLKEKRLKKLEENLFSKINKDG